MNILSRTQNLLRAALQAHGPASVKARLWNREFSRGRWACLEQTAGDFVYGRLTQHARGGAILDLGCGSGNTATELDERCYETYRGVDISDVALVQARERSAAIGRGGRNRFEQADIATYVPTQKYDLILFRDSLYYVRPPQRIAPMLERYAASLNPGGVFIVRLFNAGGRYAQIARIIAERYRILEEHRNAEGALVIVFEPRRS